jgi:toxin ParE1/3/4
VAEFSLASGVEDELWAIWQYTADDNPDAATRVVEAAYETFKPLAANSGLGRLRKFRDPRLKGVRSWLVSGFDNYLIFYRAVPKGIEVLHVYHGARDIEVLFGEKRVGWGFLSLPVPADSRLREPYVPGQRATGRSRKRDGFVALWRSEKLARGSQYAAIGIL